jgi:hypothetical protein
MARHVSMNLLAAASIAAGGGCVESFGGSNLQIDFSEGVPISAGDDADGLQAPANTYFSFYAVQHIEDDDGNVTQSYLFEAHRFEIRPVIDTGSPCFIEIEGAAFPGLHITMYGDEVREDICDRLGHDRNCFEDPLDPPEGASEGDVTDVLAADIRLDNLGDLQSQVKAVTSFSDFAYPAAEPDCNATGTQIPAPSCTDDASNAQRLAACKALWATGDDLDGDGNSDIYEGSDKVFTLPNSGKLYGMVEGPNPINSGFVGGATIFVDEVLDGFDAYTIHWQFKDNDGDGEPDYPAGFLDTHDASPTGYPFLTGEPENRVRGVINARLTTPFSTSAFAEIAIFADLDDDDVHF